MLASRIIRTLAGAAVLFVRLIIARPSIEGTAPLRVKRNRSWAGYFFISDKDSAVKIQRAYKTEMDPNETQRRLFRGYSGAVRFAYNWMLARREAHYKKTAETISSYALTKEFRTLKDTEFPWFREYASRVEETAARSLDAAYQMFFKMCKGELPKPRLQKPRKDGKPAGFPRFKSRHGKPTSFKFWGLKPTDVQADKIRLSCIGWVRLKEQGYLPQAHECSKILCMTVSIRAGRWFVSLQVEEDIDIRPTSPNVIGLDVGSRYLAVASDGRKWENPRALRTAQRKLKKLQKKLSRQTKDSNRWQNTKARIGRLHYRIVNVRTHAIHQITSDVLDRQQHNRTPAVICIEDLNVKGMTANHNLAMSIADASLAELHRQIQYKAEWLGVLVVKADRFYPSSKTCSACGVVNKGLQLGDSEFVCPACGFVVDRDLNAAVNLREYALQELASKIGESINARGGGGAGRADVLRDETAPVKREAEMLSAMPV